jgi:hypothetical protein
MGKRGNMGENWLRGKMGKRGNMGENWLRGKMGKRGNMGENWLRVKMGKRGNMGENWLRANMGTVGISWFLSFINFHQSSPIFNNFHQFSPIFLGVAPHARRRRATRSLFGRPFGLAAMRPRYACLTLKRLQSSR